MRKLSANQEFDGWGGYESKSSNDVDRTRLPVLAVLVLAGVSLLLIRLTFLQVVQGAEFRQRSDSNRIIERQVTAMRGVISDRNGERLVVNQPVSRLLTSESGRVLVEPKWLSRQEALQMEATASGRVISDVTRGYPFGPYLAHVLGYVGEVSQEDVAERGYAPGSLVGKSGLELSYEEVLRGQPGLELVEVDAGGVLLRRVGQRQPVAGSDLGLALDLGLQRVLARELAGRKGAAVATNPQTGEVLALVSSPTFDPNEFSPENDEHKKDWDGQLEGFVQLGLGELLVNEDQPLLNRAVAGVYPPGSVYKIVPALAGLETEVVDAATEVEDTGSIEVEEYSYRNWYYLQYGRTEGLVDVVTALKRSNDIYFYRVGEWLGAERLARWSEEFGLGKVTGIDLPGEKNGLVPNPVWKERVKGEAWFLGNTYHMSIGQGDLLVTPLQLNQAMEVVANGGRLCEPQVVVSIAGEDRLEVNCREVGVSDESLEVVIDGLVQACQSGGTAYPFFDFDLSEYGSEYEGEGRDRVACKTGTAQHFGGEVEPHAWFSVFAPVQNPEIQLTVLVEAAGEGSQVAAPVALEALEYWFGQRKN